MRIAVDIGGTFTDLVLTEAGRVIATGKVLTTPDDPSRAVVTGVTDLVEGRDPTGVVEIIHGTTLVANALIERKGVPTALITTQGFRDILAMGREQRFDLYDLFLEMPQPLVPRRRRWEVGERVLVDGRVDVALDEGELVTLCAAAREEAVESIAVCFLHSYRRPEHEQRARQVIASQLPEVSVSLSSEVSPEIGEYHRVSTTVANAFVLPVVDRYLATLEKRLVEVGIGAALRIMLSNGGLASTETARRFPVRLLESGPAAGVLGAGYLASGSDRVLAFDMGGTTAKAALVEEGRPVLAREHEAARMYRFTRGSGLPIKVPVIDLIEIGAGGGSIARVGLFGLPKVGPDSASSVPGPACYGLGGADPTVTDADLLLGYLDPANFLGGDMVLDVDAARRALRRLGEELGLGTEAAAAAVHRVVNEAMASAARMHSIERGRDLRAYTLVATGGAGPVHAWGVARALGVSRLVFPPRAGVASAFGMLTAPAAFEFARSIPAVLAEIDWDEVSTALGEMLEEGSHQLQGTNARPEDVVVSVDVRYEGQGDALTIALGPALPDQPASEILARFAAEYERLYGSRPGGVEPEVLTWRMRVAGETPAPQIAAVMSDGEPEEGRRRRMWFAEAGGFLEGQVYQRSSLPVGFRFTGPAVVEERESTIVVGPGGTALVAESGNIEASVDG